MDTERPHTLGPGTAMDTDHARTLGPGTAMDTNRLCQTGATTVDRDRPMRLHCHHDRAWPCPIGPVVALGGTVSIPWLVEAPDEKAAERVPAKSFTLSEWQRKRLLVRERI